MTNFEKIKQMSIDEMAELLTDISDSCSECNCVSCKYRSKVGYCGTPTFRHWLEQEAKE